MTNHRRRRPVGRRAVWFSAAAAVAVIAAAALAISVARQKETRSGPITPSGFRSQSPSQPAGAQSSHGSGQPSPGSSASPGDPGVVAKQSGPAARLIPTSGAYLGAYVAPASYTPDAEIAAVQSFQRTVGARISLVHNYHPWYSPFPNAADQYFVRSGKVLLLTWGGTPDTRKIIAGDYDSLITERARAVKRLHRPILLEFRHEMDRPNLQWAIHGPKNFIGAWDHVRKIFAKVGATNVGWVWCPTGWGFGNGRAQPFYPGNSKVDWVCADIYAVSATQTLQDAAHPFLAWARHTHKPVLIGEFAAGGSPAAWPRWLLAAGVLAEFDPQIKGMAYFDANGTDSQGRPFQYWLGGNRPALRAFREMLSWPVFRPVLPSSR